MKTIFTVVLLAIFSVMQAQHVATLSSNSDMKTVKGGFVEASFTLDLELSPAEATDVREWGKSNKEILNITLDGNTLVIKTKPENHERNIYQKLFMQAGIHAITVITEGVATTMSLEDFFDRYNL